MSPNDPKGRLHASYEIRDLDIQAVDAALQQCAQELGWSQIYTGAVVSAWQQAFGHIFGIKVEAGPFVQDRPTDKPN